MDTSYYNDLFNRLIDGNLSPEQTEELIAWLGREDADPYVSQLILAQLNQPVPDKEISPELIKALAARLPSILDRSATQPKVHILRRPWFRYAAAIILVVGAALFFWLSSNKTTTQPPAIVNTGSKTNDIDPGKDGAILTLEDGTQVVLDSLGNGVIASQSGAKVVLNNGQLVYNTDGTTSQKIVYNTITTPKGRQFQLLLPDQTKVWLNATSSLTYPTVFTGNEREVKITGEAYFEVTKSKQPFMVHINDETTVEVLGTHFNINSYTNEADIKTTLLEGSVQVVNGTGKTIIKPGQQAKIDNNTDKHIQVVNAVDIDRVMAWKNGVFDCQDASLEEVMRQLERWYDIEVVYEKEIPKFEFVGKIGRDLKLSEVMRGLELSKVHCRLEGRRLIVFP